MKRKAKMPKGPARDAVVARFVEAKATAKALSEEIGVTRQYAGELMREHKRRAAAAPAEEVAPVQVTASGGKDMPPTPSEAAPSPSPEGIPPLPPAPGETAAPEDSPRAGNPLDDALRGIPSEGAPPPDGPFQPDVVAPAPSALDQKRIKAGRRLAELAGRGFGKTLARRVHGVRADDPRLKLLDQPNEILDLALEENDDKMHKLGGLVRGWLGIGLGYFVEVFRVGEIFGAPPARPPARREDSPSPARQEEPEFEAPPTTEGGTSVGFGQRDEIPGL